MVFCSCRCPPLVRLRRLQMRVAAPVAVVVTVWERQRQEQSGGRKTTTLGVWLTREK